MNIRALLSLSAAALLTMGCVSQQKFDQAQDRIRSLNYKLEVAEKTLNKKNQEISGLLQKKRLVSAELETLKKTANLNQSRFKAHIEDVKENVASSVEARVRAELEAQYKKRMAELKESVPELQVSNYGGLILESGIFFRSGRHVLQPAGKKMLTNLIAKFKSPDFLNYNIEIAGHSDSDPIRHSKSRYTDNHILAANRANEVRRYLISQGIGKDRLFISAWGNSRPLQPGAKSKNRRVEILMHTPDTPKTLTVGSPR